MSFTDKVGTVFDDEDIRLTIRHRTDKYNHAIVKGIGRGRISYYKAKLENEGMNFELVEAGNGPEFEIWEDL